MVSLYPERDFRKFQFPISSFHISIDSGLFPELLPECTCGDFQLFQNKMEVEKSPVTKKRSVRSWVWEHFKLSSDQDENATCNHCAKQVSGRNGTNKLKHHLLSVHQIIKPQDSTATVKSTKKMKLDDPQAASITTKLYRSSASNFTDYLERISLLQPTFLFQQFPRAQNLQNL